MRKPPGYSVSGEPPHSLSLSDKEILTLLSEAWWPALVAASLPYQDKRDDEGHAALVTLNAACFLKIYDHGTEGERRADQRIVLAAALLHDIGWSCIEDDRRIRLFSGDISAPEEHRLRVEHERLGAALAERLMNEAGCPKEIFKAVIGLIDGHDTRRQTISVEDRILRDADKFWMVTEKGFAADLRRRRQSPAGWAAVLRERFLRDGELSNSAVKKLVFEKLDEFDRLAETVREKKAFNHRALIAHYRVGWTDGVSLEIEKRKVILEELGFDVFLVSGPGSLGADYIIDELDFESDEVKAITQNAFGRLEMTEDRLAEMVYKLSDTIERKLASVIIEIEPDFILTHNIFSHGRHIAAARAFCNVLTNYNAASLTTHHDFYWERADFRNPSCGWVSSYLAEYVPPVIPRMRHAVINSLAAVELEKRTGIKAMIFPDTLDFTLKPWLIDDYNRQFRKDFNLNEDDILILQATRIVRRKGIELIPPIIKRLNEADYMNRLIGKRLYNGKIAGKDSRFVFMLAGYAEHEAEDYLEQLSRLMDNEGIEYRLLHPYIAAERGELQGRKVYSLFDTYPHADLVSYPSLYEGWGNQFIEAVFSRRPVILFEYPVYRSDIKPIGYSLISMGGQADTAADGLSTLSPARIEDCCNEIVEWLLSDETPARLEDNFRLARKNNSYDYLRELMRRSMEHYEDF